MKPQLKTVLLALGPLLVCTFALAQSLYKYVDANGRVTYSDQPPTGNVKSQEIVKIPGASNSGAARQISDQDSQFKKRQEDTARKQADTAKKEELESSRREACSRSRVELRALRDSTPLARLNEKGERVQLDESTREDEARRVESFLGENCQSNG